MNKKNNIYNYKPTKEMNEEVHFFLTKGRITLKAFILRLIFILVVWLLFFLIYEYYFLERYWYWFRIGKGTIRNISFLNSYRIYENFYFIVLPAFLTFFIIIQAVKRLHDTNNSGWFLLFPVHNLVLLFTLGKNEHNSYGLSPYKNKDVKYFDELDNKKE